MNRKIYFEEKSKDKRDKKPTAAPEIPVAYLEDHHPAVWITLQETNIATQNPPFEDVLSYQKWWFSIAMFVCQRVYHIFEP